jgi:predicted amidophosphoribosyltransferase
MPSTEPTEILPPLGEPPGWATVCCVCGEPVTTGRFICEACGYSVLRSRQDEAIESDEPPDWIGELDAGDA